MREINPRLNILTSYKKMGNIINPYMFNDLSLKASYNFNGNALDLSTNGLDLTIPGGGSTIIGDRLNQAGTSYASVLDPTGICSFGSGAMSIACKVNVTAMNAFNWIANKRDSSSIINNAPAEWNFIFNAGKLSFSIIDSSKSATASLNAASVQTLSANTTYHVAVTFSGGIGNNFKIYIDGVLVSHTYTPTGAYTQMRNTGAKLTLSNTGGWGSGLGLTGWMDNFRLYSKELTQTEITQLANE